MNNSLRYPNSLASNFPTDCQIPHLENNIYIYGGGPPFKPHPCRFSNPKQQSSHSPEKPYQHNFEYSAGYSNSKQLRSTNPYSTGYESSNSTLKGKISGYGSEKKQETPVKKDENSYMTPKNVMKNSGYGQIDPIDSNLKFSARSGGDSRGPIVKNDLKNTENDRMKEFQLLNSEFNNRISREEAEKAEEMYRKEIMLKEKEMLAQKQQEYEQYLKRKQDEEAENNRRQREKHEYDQLMARKRQEEYEHNQERIRQELQAHEKRLIDQREYEKNLIIQKQAHDQLLREQQAEQIALRSRQEAYNHQKRLQDQEDYEKMLTMQKENQAYEQYLNEQQRLKDSENEYRQRQSPYTHNSKSSNKRLSESHQTLREQIGRESRQFIREKEQKSRNFATPERKQDHLSPQSAIREAQTDTKPKNSSKNEKIRSLSNKKREAHHFQQTFSTKVKFMANQPYTFANSTKSTLSRHS